MNRQAVPISIVKAIAICLINACCVFLSAEDKLFWYTAYSDEVDAYLRADLLKGSGHISSFYKKFNAKVPSQLSQVREQSLNLLGINQDVLQQQVNERRRYLERKHKVVNTELGRIDYENLLQASNADDKLLLYVVPIDYINLIVNSRRIANEKKSENNDNKHSDDNKGECLIADTKDCGNGAIVNKIDGARERLFNDNRIEKGLTVVELIESRSLSKAVSAYVELSRSNSVDDMTWPIPELGYYLSNALFSSGEDSDKRTAIDIRIIALKEYDNYIDLPQLAMMQEIVSTSDGIEMLIKAGVVVWNVESLMQVTKDYNNMKHIYPFRSILEYVGRQKSDWQPPLLPPKEFHEKSRSVNKIIHEKIIPNIDSNNRRTIKTVDNSDSQHGCLSGLQTIESTINDHTDIKAEEVDNGKKDSGNLGISLYQLLKWGGLVVFIVLTITVIGLVRIKKGAMPHQ